MKMTMVATAITEIDYSPATGFWSETLDVMGPKVLIKRVEVGTARAAFDEFQTFGEEVRALNRACRLFAIRTDGRLPHSMKNKVWWEKGARANPRLVMTPAALAEDDRRRPQLANPGAADSTSQQESDL